MDGYGFDALPISWRDFFLQTDWQFGYYAHTSGATPKGAFRFRHRKSLSEKRLVSGQSFFILSANVFF
jgi:hypothetical protein